MSSTADPAYTTASIRVNLSPVSGRALAVWAWFEEQRAGWLGSDKRPSVRWLLERAAVCRISVSVLLHNRDPESTTHKPLYRLCLRPLGAEIWPERRGTVRSRPSLGTSGRRSCFRTPLALTWDWEGVRVVGCRPAPDEPPRYRCTGLLGIAMSQSDQPVSLPPPSMPAESLRSRVGL